MQHTREIKSVFGISAIMAFRLLGVFMILPIFAPEAIHLKNATPFLIGVALGIYGLAQSCFQIPFGWLSDRIGRKPMIAVGLGFFILGSGICALSHSIFPLIIGRALQGIAAIGSILLALIADLTRDEHRAQAMASMGLTIGFSFSISLILGPFLNNWFGLSGIFWISTAMGVFSFLLLYFTVPTPPKIEFHEAVESVKFKAVFNNRELLRLDYGIFVLHAVLTSLFIVVPLALTHVLALSNSQQTYIYLAALIFSYLFAIPLIIAGEKKRILKKIFISSVAMLALTQFVLFMMNGSLTVILAAMLLFFVAFTVLEASLPSLISKLAPIRTKGTAMGIYSTSQFLGIFIGGIISGALLEHFGLKSVLLFSLLLSCTWLLVAFNMKEPPYLSTIFIPSSSRDVFYIKDQLAKWDGIKEIIYQEVEQLFYLKIDRKIVDENELRKSLREGNLAD
jgi:MFS family permease